MTAVLIALGVLNLAVLVAVLVMVRRLGRRIIGVRKIQRKERLHRLWPQIEALIGLYRLLDGTGDLPSLRFASVSPDFLLHVTRAIQQHAPRRIVECGCGSSTIAMAQALRALAVDGHIYAIENYEPSVAMVREQLQRHGLERFVTLIEAPLKEKPYDGFAAPIAWYDLPAGAVPDGIDLLLVDGPLGIRRKDARYPAGPELLPKLSRTGRVFVDDANRPDERAMVERWCKLYPALEARSLAAEKGCVELYVRDAEARQHGLPSAPA